MHDGQECVPNDAISLFDPYLNGQSADGNQSMNVNPHPTGIGLQQEFNEGRNLEDLLQPMQEPDAFDVSHLINQTHQKPESTTSDICHTQEKNTDTERGNSSSTSNQKIADISEYESEQLEKCQKTNPTSETSQNNRTAHSNKSSKKLQKQQTQRNTLPTADLSDTTRRTRSQTRSSSRKRTPASGSNSGSPDLKQRSRSCGKTPVSQGGARRKNSTSTTAMKQPVSPTGETGTSRETEAATRNKKKKTPKVKTKKSEPGKSSTLSAKTLKKRGRKRQAETRNTDTEHDDTEGEEQQEVDEEHQEDEVVDPKTHALSFSSKLKKLLKQTP